MAFQIITGTHTHANQVLDALAANWTFDSYDNESDNHSVTWGAATLQAAGSTNITLVRDGSTVFSFPVGVGNNYHGIFKIVKTSNAVLLRACTDSETYESIIVITTAKQLSDPEQTDKIIVGTSPSGTASNTRLAAATTEQSRNQTNYFSIYSGSSEGYQLFKYVQPVGGYEADNAYIVVTVPFTSPSLAEVTFGGSTYYIGKFLAIRDEGEE